MTDGGLSKTEAWNLQLQAQITSKDTEIARLREENGLLQIFKNIYEDHGKDTLGGLMSRLASAEAARDAAEKQVAVLAGIVEAVLCHDERGQGVGYAEAMDALKAALASLPARAALMGAVVEVAERVAKAVTRRNEVFKAYDEEAPGYKSGDIGITDNNVRQVEHALCAVVAALQAGEKTPAQPTTERKSRDLCVVPGCRNKRVWYPEDDGFYCKQHETGEKEAGR